MTSPTPRFNRYLQQFSEDPGYLNHASYGPPSAAVLEWAAQSMALAAEGSVGVLETLHRADLRAREAFARLSGFSFDNTFLVPGTSYGLFQLAFGVSGTVLFSPGEFPANRYPWLRAQQAGISEFTLMGEARTPVTAELVAANLTSRVTAVAVSAVDFSTGYKADLAAIREAIGPDRLLIVDAIQGFGAVDQDWSVADAIVAGGQKWIRGGWGAGAVAVSENALERIKPALGGWTGVENLGNYDADFQPERADALKFGVTNLSPFATGSLATALELIEEAGISNIAKAVTQKTETLIEALENAGVDVLNVGGPSHRAGIVVAGFPEGNATQAHQALALEGISATLHGRHRIRFAPHATTQSETLSHAALILAGFA